MIDSFRDCRGPRPARTEIILPARQAAIAAGRLALAVVMALVLSTLISSGVLACPACASSNESGQVVIPILLGFMVVPFALFGGAVWYLRRQFRSEAEERSLPVAVSTDRIIYASDFVSDRLGSSAVGGGECNER
jgi:hypothetical protein